MLPGITSSGHKVLLHIGLGNRESYRRIACQNIHNSFILKKLRKQAK